MARFLSLTTGAIGATLLTAPLAAQAHGRLHLGPRIGYNFDAEALTLGAQLSVPVGRHLEFYPSVDYHDVDVGSLYSLNLDIKYRVPLQGTEWFYVGTGLGILNRSIGDNDHSDAGLNLFLGAESRWGRVHPFAEGRATIADGSQVMLMGGLNFTL
jgi:hypothetical protein